LTSPFPTSKAYGVTTSNTVRAAIELGHDCSILAPLGKSSVDSRENIFPIKGWLFNKANMLYRWKASGKIAFNLIRFVAVFKCIRHIWKFKPNIVWNRDLFSSFLILLFKPKTTIIICEIHRINSISEKVIIRFMLRKKTVVLAPIREGMIQSDYVHKFNFIVSGMAVNKSFLDLGSIKDLSRPEVLNLVYVGRPYSSNQKLNVDFIKDLAKVIHLNSLNWKIYVVGIPKEFFISESSIIVVENLPHDLIPELLQNMDVGLVIYPELEYFKQSFPIKIVEYAAMNLFILASRTESHEKILGADKAIYYEPDNVEDCYNKIRMLDSDWKNYGLLRQNARTWAEGKSYKERVSNLLIEVQTRQ
jgi:glycosyltransferase involved in cell wall biosynthesis